MNVVTNSPNLLSIINLEKGVPHLLHTLTFQEQAPLAATSHSFHEIISTYQEVVSTFFKDQEISSDRQLNFYACTSNFCEDHKLPSNWKWNVQNIINIGKNLPLFNNLPPIFKEFFELFKWNEGLIIEGTIFNKKAESNIKIRKGGKDTLISCVNKARMKAIFVFENRRWISHKIVRETPRGICVNGKARTIFYAENVVRENQWSLSTQRMSGEEKQIFLPNPSTNYRELQFYKIILNALHEVSKNFDGENFSKRDFSCFNLKDSITKQEYIYYFDVNKKFPHFYEKIQSLSQ